MPTDLEARSAVPCLRHSKLGCTLSCGLAQRAQVFLEMMRWSRYPCPGGSTLHIARGLLMAAGILPALLFTASRRLKPDLMKRL